jgi:prepilin peptidase CpaA
VGEVLSFLGAGIVVALAAAWFDSRTGHIPNWLTYGALAVGPFAHLFYTLAHTGRRIEALEELGYAALGAFVCAILPVALFRANALGGGDVKLFVALGGLLQPLLGLEAELWSFCAAALLAPVRLAWDGKLFQTVANAAYLAVNPFLPKERQRLLDRENVSWFRMGPAVLAGVVFTAYLHRRG